MHIVNRILNGILLHLHLEFTGLLIEEVDEIVNDNAAFVCPVDELPAQLMLILL